MYNNNNWAGNSQVEMANSLQEFVEMAPKLPIKKIKTVVKSVGQSIAKLASQPESTDTACDCDHQETAYSA